MVEENYFKELSKIKAPIEKKGNLTYISWADAWDKLKQTFPGANYKIYQAEGGMPYYANSTGGFVKVGVTVMENEHIVFLPIMDNYNKAIPIDKLDVFQINKSIQRALAKGIAMHGMGLYVYRGEDLPNDIEKKPTTQTAKEVDKIVKPIDKHRCSFPKCNAVITKSVSEYSISHYGKPLCFNHQKEYQVEQEKPTKEEEEMSIEEREALEVMNESEAR